MSSVYQENNVPKSRAAAAGFFLRKNHLLLSDNYDNI
ncbi:hypothetical protein N786_09815 [Bacillus amyloliquefaciens UASWS BA1]|nr:hypothetical protein U722_13975 [Bacillus amyloliquefaciens LFB112]ERK83427.1 hypothetical protein N786_09815 [Bacillus amyloliquefaciens UASWS BA1]